MVRARLTLKKGLPVAAGIVAGFLLAGIGTSGNPVQAAQDPQVAMQIQQAITNHQIQMQNQLGILQTRIDTLEREMRDVRFRMQSGGGRPSVAVPLPSDPIPGATTWGRVVSRISESERFVLKGLDGARLAEIALSSEGPALLLYDVNGNMSTALIATPEGPELRMADAEGALQTVLPVR